MKLNTLQLEETHGTGCPWL